MSSRSFSWQGQIYFCLASAYLGRHGGPRRTRVYTEAIGLPSTRGGRGRIIIIYVCILCTHTHTHTYTLHTLKVRLLWRPFVYMHGHKNCLQLHPTSACCCDQLTGVSRADDFSRSQEKNNTICRTLPL